MQHQQLEPQANAMYTDGYGNYVPSAPAPPQFGGMAQMGYDANGYDFQGGSAFAPPAPNFSGGISCPAPPGMSDGWIPPPSIQPEESEADRLKREGEDCFNWLKFLT